MWRLFQFSPPKSQTSVSSVVFACVCDMESDRTEVELTQPQLSVKRVRPEYNQRIRRTVHRLNAVDIQEELMETIFSFLPIKDAVQTSILSSRFRDTWRFGRILHFDQKSDGTLDFITSVERVFNLHSGPEIQSLRLRFIPTGVEDYVGKWIEMSAKKRVEEVELDFCYSREPFRLSSEFFNIETLKVVKLHSCEVNLPVPPILRGSTLLNTVTLRNAVNVTPMFLATLFQNCMLLEYLDISQCDGIVQLKIFVDHLRHFRVLKVGDCRNLVEISISAPSLRSFHYSGYMIRFIFLQIFQLKDVLINLIPNRLFIPYTVLGRFFREIHHVTVFSTTASFVQGLCSKSKEGGETGETEMQFYFRHLKEFQVFMEGSCFCNIHDISSFLNTCPQLERLFIDLNDFSFEYGYYWEVHHRERIRTFNRSYENLKFIKITGFKYEDRELELVNFLLTSAPFLETLVLVTPKPKGRGKEYAHAVANHDEAIVSWRKSADTQIKVYQHFNDNSGVDSKHSRVWFAPRNARFTR